MSGQTKWVLGLAGLCLLGFVLMVGSWRSPSGPAPGPIVLPQPERLGTVLPATPPPVAAPSPRPERRLGIAPAAKGSSRLMPASEEMKRLQKDGSVAY